ncbi:Scr1 family TA system antitoxin-like transcriptional regulator [Streptomyces sp. NPDC054866]
MARERVTVLAAEGFERGEKNTDIAKELRVSLRSVERWRRAWREKGIAGLHCSGPAKRPKVSEEQFAVLEQELLRGAVSHGWPNERWTLSRVSVLISAVAARIARSRFLYEGGHRYVVLMEESVLRYRTAAPEAMRGQLRHLLAVMPLASVSLGIIPFTAQRTVWPLEAFYLHDDTTAVVETLTAEIKVKQPRELADYAKAFAGLAAMAVYGDAARDLIRAAIDALE